MVRVEWRDDRQDNILETLSTQISVLPLSTTVIVILNYVDDKENWKNLVHHCMECDFSWDVSAKSYEGLYNETANLW